MMSWWREADLVSRRALVAAAAGGIILGVTPVRGSKNVLTDLVRKRGGKAVTPTARELSTHRYTFDFPAFAPTAAVAIDLVGKDRTIACTIDVATLKRMREAEGRWAIAPSSSPARCRPASLARPHPLRASH